MKSRLISLAIATLTMFGCNRVKLPSGHSDPPYLSVLEQGLSDQTDLTRFPRGEVQIMSDLLSKVYPSDASQLKFPSQYLEYLQKAQKDGLLNLALKGQDRTGTRLFTASPTEKLLQLHDAKRSNDKFVAVQIGAIKVLEVLKEDEYKGPAGAPGDEFKLVIGRCRDTPTAQGKTLGIAYATQEPKDLKFRAVLQFNPFNKTYTYVVADVGKPEEPGWKTNYVK